MERYYIIRESDLKELVYNEILIRYLNAAGVDNWEGWSNAWEMLLEEYGEDFVPVAMEEMKDEGLIEETELGCNFSEATSQLGRHSSCDESNSQ